MPAFVTRSDIVDYTDSDGSVTYHLDTTYRYEVAGAKHWGEFTRGARSKSHSMELLKRYAVETEIEVHYDPTDSATSFLARRDRKDS
ncbi:hypothetical protein A9W97_20015 [Mycobacterium gordonae]|nr:hypothetical protein A9W97_20015 [Mycobacterium gordonae]